MVLCFMRSELVIMLLNAIDETEYAEDVLILIYVICNFSYFTPELLKATVKDILTFQNIPA